jgi:hypothetical protein
MESSRPLNKLRTSYYSSPHAAGDVEGRIDADRLPGTDTVFSDFV